MDDEHFYKAKGHLDGNPNAICRAEKIGISPPMSRRDDEAVAKITRENLYAAVVVPWI